MAKNHETVEKDEKSLSVIEQGAFSLSAASTSEEILKFRKRMEEFTLHLNKAPDKRKVQKHEGHDYLPISMVEKDLDKVYFGLVQYELIGFWHVLNEVVVHARIKVFHPVIMQWMNYDGIGAGILQQDAKTKVSDFIYHKKGNALVLAAPNAYAEAIKNGAKKIGKRFGSDLNRKHEDHYYPNYKTDPDNQPLNS